MNKDMRELVDLLKKQLPEVPATWRYEGQTIDERCEAWLLHIIEQLEEEIE